MAKRITIILLLSFLSFVLFFVATKLSQIYNKKHYDTSYKSYQEGINAENYVLLPVSKVIQQDVISGNINFDTLSHKFILPLKHQYYDEQKQEATVTNCTYVFDKKGVLISKTESAEESEQENEFEHCVKLEDILFDNSKLVSVAYFLKESYRYDWNPFRGFGSPTGAGRNMTWKGTAYVDLKLKKESLKLKIEEVFAENFFSNKVERNDFALYISLYQLPIKFQKMSSVSFFVRHKAYGPNELYVIKSK
ncbi:hypothetical protein JI750_12665 [Flavobacterium sp. GN10]|uniref:Uncharacterized protein n=1 Tax=Flavobacterium tagetis TaxID=2801336 RepID=A0ABS1KEG9_9FLAO|nr:hypothetical protein [Flavobacterium tagetis]MBL0737750.1 hypothetical protein [Flavobacterium tagetis]